MDEFLYGSEYYCEDCNTYHAVSVWMKNDSKEWGDNHGYYITDSDGDIEAEFDEKDYEKMLKEFPETQEHIEIDSPKYKKEIWHVLCSKWLGWKTFGCKALKGRKEKGKYLPWKELPDEIKEAFDINDRGHIETFTSDDIIKEFVNNGAKVTKKWKKWDLVYRITFEVERKVKK